MPIQFLSPADVNIGSYRSHIPAAACEQILAGIEAVDNVLPGVKNILETSNLGIVFDPGNLHGIFTPAFSDHWGAYYWPLHKLYLGNTGIEKSLAHECVHILDMLSGPSIAQTVSLFGDRFICPRSLEVFFSTGEGFTSPFLSRRFKRATNFEGWFMVRMLTGFQSPRRSPAAKRNLTRRLEQADISDPESLLVITERVAQLFEQYSHFALSPALPAAQPPEVENPTALLTIETSLGWGDDWLQANSNDILRFFQGLLLIIQDRIGKGQLKSRLREMADNHHTSFWSLLATP